MSSKRTLVERERVWYEGSASATDEMQRRYEAEQANVLAPVKQWGRPPASESSRPKSAQRLHEAREKDSKFNQSVGRPGSAPIRRQHTPWQPRQPSSSAWQTPPPPSMDKPSSYGGYGESLSYGERDEGGCGEQEPEDDYAAATDSSHADEDSALRRLAQIHANLHASSRPKTSGTLLEAWNEQLHHGEAGSPTNLNELRMRRSAARQESTLVQLNHQSAAASHATWVEELTFALDSFHKEQCELDEEIEELLIGRGKFKEMYSVLKYLCSKNVRTAFVTWLDKTLNADRRVLKAKQEALVAEVAVASSRLKAEELKREESLARSAALAVASKNSHDYRLLLSLFSRLVGDSKRVCWSKWHAHYAAAVKQKLYWRRFFAKVVNMQLYAAYHKWLAHLTFSQLPEEGVIERIEQLVARRRAELEVYESAARDEFSRTMERHLEHMEVDSRQKLVRVLSRLFQQLLFGGWRRWKLETKGFLAQRKRVFNILSRLCKVELVAGWAAFTRRVALFHEARRNRKAVELKREIAHMRDQLAHSTSQVRSVVSTVEQMRDSLRLQAEAARMVATAFPAVAQTIGLCIKSSPVDARRAQLAQLAPSRAAAPGAAPALRSEKRAQLLVFLHKAREPDGELEHALLSQDLAATVPGFQRHLRSMKRLALAGDPRFAAAVQAFEQIGDPVDLWETIEMINEMGP